MLAEDIKKWLRGITLEEDPEKGPDNVGEGDNWCLLIGLIQAIWTKGKILQQLTWVIVVLLPKGGGDYRGISLLELLWKVVERIMDQQLNALPSWTTHQATTAGSSLGSEDNVCEDTLSSQSTYKINSGCPYYKASIAPNPKQLNDFEPTKEQLETVYGGIMEEVNKLRLQNASKELFLPLINKATPSILILPKFKPKMLFFGFLMILN
jgi:hypothetical protein